MNINRLIGEYPDKIEEYINYTKEDFHKAMTIFSRQKCISENQVKACLGAQFLKKNNIWIGDQFKYKNEIHTLSNIRLRYPPFVSKNPSLVSLCDYHAITVYGATKFYSNLIGSCSPDFDDVAWLKGAD